MSTKKLQILNTIIKKAEEADTLDGKHASEFAAASDVEQLKAQVGDTSVSEQISAAISGKSDAAHTHDDRYYTEAEVDDKLSGKSDVSHTHEISELTDLSDASVGHAETADAVAWANVTGKPSTYAPSAHSHTISDVTSLQTTLDAKVPTTRTVNGKALSANITLTASDVGADASGSASSALTSAKAYTDSEISEWVGDETVSEQISTAIASKSDVGHTHTYSDVGADKSGAAASALTDAKSYTDTKISNLINSAPTTLDTLGEIAAAMEENADVVAALEESIGTKAAASDLTSHTSNKSNPHGVTLSQLGVTATATELNYVDGVTSAIQTQLNAKVPTSRTVNGKALSANITLSASDVGADASGAANTALTNAKAYTDAEITEWIGDSTVSEQISAAVANKADTGHTHSAYVNQNAFSNVTIGSTTIAADAATDTLTFVAGSNVTLTPDATNDKITIAAKDTVYTHPSYTARTGVPTANATPAFGGTFNVSQPVSDATGHITAINSRTITIPNTAATTSVAGLMSSTDKTKLDGIATGANKTTVDSSLSTTSTNPVQNKIVATAISNLNTLVGDTAVATQISNAIASKQNTITGGATTITSSNLTASRALVSDSNGKVAVSAVTSTELGYLDGVTSAIQTQLNAKAASGHTHDYLPLSGGTLTGNLSGKYLTGTWLQTTAATEQTPVTKVCILDSSGLVYYATPANVVKAGLTIDSALSSSSTNPVQNKAVNTAISNLNTLVGDTAVSTQINNALSEIDAVTIDDSDINIGEAPDINATTLGGRTESQLSVYSATLLGGKPESDLNVDTANNATKLNGQEASYYATASNVLTNTNDIASVDSRLSSAEEQIQNILAADILSMKKLTQSEYDALTAKDTNTLYVIVE